MSSKPSTTIGFERQFNPALRFTELDAFIADAASIAAPKPPNLARIVELNRGPFLAARSPVEELAAPPADTQCLDVRTVEEHLAGHRPGAVNVPVSGASFATKAGFILDASRPVTVLAATADEALHAVTRLQAVALLDLTGFVLGAGDERTEPVAAG